MSSTGVEEELVALNVGGVLYTTSKATLLDDKAAWFNTAMLKNKTTNEKRSTPLFIDRDGPLFRYVLDYLRDKQISFDESSGHFGGFSYLSELRRFRNEANFYNLVDLVRLVDEMLARKCLNSVDLSRSSEPAPKPTSTAPTMVTTTGPSGCSTNGVDARKYITLGYRCKLSSNTTDHMTSSSDLTDLKFRKTSRIVVSGQVHLLREVFGETLNESRDPDHHEVQRYTTRFYLKHLYLEHAYDTLAASDFELVSQSTVGANCVNDTKDMAENESNKWLHYTELVFKRN